jgi:hypothetical protein
MHLCNGVDWKQEVNSHFIEESQHEQVIMLNGLAQNSRIKISSYFDYLSQRVGRLQKNDLAVPRRFN